MIQRCHPITSPNRYAALGRVELNWSVFLGWTYYGTSREGSGLLSMQPFGSNKWCSTDAPNDVRTIGRQSCHFFARNETMLAVL